MDARERRVLLVGVPLSVILTAFGIFQITKAEKKIPDEIVEKLQEKHRAWDGRGHNLQTIYIVTASNNTCYTFPPSILALSAISRTYPEFARYPDAALPDRIAWQSWDSNYTIMFPNSPISGVNNNDPISVSTGSSPTQYSFIAAANGSYDYVIKNSGGASCSGGQLTGIQIDR